MAITASEAAGRRQPAFPVRRSGAQSAKSDGRISSGMPLPPAPTLTFWLNADAAFGVPVVMIRDAPPPRGGSAPLGRGLELVVVQMERLATPSWQSTGVRAAAMELDRPWPSDSFVAP